MSKGWDNATLKKLKALMGKGLSTSEIGKRLGLSKNAVVGKLNRLGWNAKAGATPAATTKTAKKAPAPAAKKTTAKPAAKKPAAAKPATKAKVATKKTETATKVNAKPATKTAKADAKTPAKPAKEPKATKTSASKNLAMHQRIIQHSLEMANLKPNQCRWPIGDPDSENFHFCGKQVFTGKPYCYEHCRLAYQFTPPKKK
jgi:GcrA cell cycle regulator